MVGAERKSSLAKQKVLVQDSKAQLLLTDVLLDTNRHY